MPGTIAIKLLKYSKSSGYTEVGSLGLASMLVSLSDDASKMIVSNSGTVRYYRIDKTTTPYTFTLTYDLGVTGFAVASQDFNFIAIGSGTSFSLYKYNSALSTYSSIYSNSVTCSNNIRGFAWTKTNSKLFVACANMKVFSFDNTTLTLA